MTQYINKETLVTEIENLIKRAEAERVLYPQTIKAAKNLLLIEDYKKLLSIIDTLTVEIGVDLGDSKGDESVKYILDTKNFELIESEDKRIRNEKLVLSIVPADNLTAYNCALEVARRKDAQPISELGGWHTELPTEDGCYLVGATTIPYKNSEFLVAEYDTNVQCWYDEAFENPIEIKRWKRI